MPSIAQHPPRAKDLPPQAQSGSANELLNWPADVTALIREMKRRAGVESDQELALFLDKSRTAIAQWRRRGAVPEGAILRLEFKARTKAAA